MLTLDFYLRSLNGIINVDKPLNIDSLEIYSKMKERIRISYSFPLTYFDRNLSGSILFFFQRSKNLTKFFQRKNFKLISVVKTDVETNNLCKLFPKYFKGNSYRSSFFSSKKQTISFIDIKFFFANNINYKKGIAIFYFRSKNKKICNQLNLGLDNIFKKNIIVNEIRRVKIGMIKENHNSIIFQDIIDNIWSFCFWKNFFDCRNLLIPSQFILKNLKRIIVKNSAINALCYGSNLMASGILEIEKEIEKGEEVLLITQKKEIIGLGEIKFNTEIIYKNLSGIIVNVKNILMEKNCYPKRWNLGSKCCLKKLTKSIRTN